MQFSQRKTETFKKLKQKLALNFFKKQKVAQENCKRSLKIILLNNLISWWERT